MLQDMHIKEQKPKNGFIEKIKLSQSTPHWKENSLILIQYDIATHFQEAI